MLSLLFSIFMGALIGYGTNTLAVEMLFRPFTPKYLGKWRLPFTPGLIPKEQARIAESLGELIEKELFSLGPEEYIQKRESLTALLCSYFTKKLKEAKLGESFARQLSHRTDAVLPFLPSGSLEDVYANTLGKLMDRELEKNLPEMIETLVYKEAGTFLGTPLSATSKRYGQELPKLKGTLMGLIHAAIQGALPQLLSSGEIRRLVVARINSLSPRDLNTLLKGLMKKELAAIEWLGALLGSLLGAVTYFAGKLF